MKVLFTCAYYPPEKAASIYLTENLTEDICKYGDYVDVYTPIPTRGVSAESRKYYKQHKVIRQHDGHLCVNRFFLHQEGNNPLLRALRYFLCNLYHLYYCLWSRYDVLFLDSTPPTQGIIGAVVKFIRKKPIVYNLQDIFPDSLVSTGLVSNKSFLWRIGQIIERISYKYSDKIIVISEDFKRNLMAKGVSESKIEIVYNWVDEHAVVPIARDKNTLFDEFGLDRDKFYVVYAGNLGSAQNIDIILEAAKATRQYADLQFLIFGTEDQSAPYKEYVRRAQISNLRILPMQPYSMVSQVYSLGNVAIVSCKKGFGNIAMPSKTWSIMSSGTAVLASFDAGTDLQHIIEANGLGRFVEAEDVNEFVGAILDLYGNPRECIQMGLRGRQYILDNLTRNIGTKKYIEIINSVYSGDGNIRV